MSDFHCLVRPSMTALHCSSHSSASRYSDAGDDGHRRNNNHYSSSRSPPFTSSDGDSESEDGMMEMENMKYSHRKSSKKRSRSPSSKEKRPEKVSTTTKALAGLEALASAAVMTKDSPLSPMPSLDPQTPSSPSSSSSSPSPLPSTAPLSPPPARLPASPSSVLHPLNGVCICSTCLPVDTLHPDVLIERLVLIQQRLPRNTKSDHLLGSLESLRYLPAEIKLKLPSMVKSFLANLASQYFGINKHSHKRGQGVTRPIAVPSPSIIQKMPHNVASINTSSSVLVS